MGQITPSQAMAYIAAAGRSGLPLVTAGLCCGVPTLEENVAGPEPAQTQPDRTRRRPVRSVLSTFTSPDSYGLLLLLILVTYILICTIHAGRAFSLVLVAEMVTLWLALHTSDAHRAVRGLATVLLVIAGVALIGNVVRNDNEQVHVFVDGAALLLYFLAPWVIVRHLAERHEIDIQTVLGAISAYLLIGMFFAFLYQFIGAAQAGNFFGAQGEGVPANYLFFSFTTLTTTGYGNLVPAANPGQTLAVLEMILGQLFLIAAVGKVISDWTPAKRRRQAKEAEEKAPE
jgi:Ion channel